jgi:hypothetical protein
MESVCTKEVYMTEGQWHSWDGKRSRSDFAICVFRRSAVRHVVPTGTPSYKVASGKCRILVGTEMLLLGSVIARRAPEPTCTPPSDGSFPAAVAVAYVSRR